MKCNILEPCMPYARGVLGSVAKWRRVAKNTARVGFQQNPICEEFA